MIYAEKIELCMGRISLLHSSIFFGDYDCPLSEQSGLSVLTVYLT